MQTLISTLIAFVGTILVFALAAQSVQEIIKTMWVIKGSTMQKAIEGLVREAAKSNRQWSIDADKIIEQVVRRLGVLGQSGFRRGKIRLDSLPADQLEDLIAKVEPADVPGLPGDRAEACAILAAIGKQAKEWYPIAINPVDDRYRRRMRVLALFSSALVVLPFNLDAIKVFHLAQTDPNVRAQMVKMASYADSLYNATEDTTHAVPAKPARDSAADSTVPIPTQVAVAPAAISKDSVNKLIAATKANLDRMHTVYNEQLLGMFQLANLRVPSWWAGTLLSILLVSLGAPFWHDLLESLFGLKNRMTAPAPAPANPQPDKAGAGKQ